MSIGVTAEHRELASSLRAWASSLDGPASVRAAEDDPAATFAEVWAKVTDMGAASIGLPEPHGGGGGSVLDAAVALEACAHALLPGPLLGTAVAAALLGELAPAAAALGRGEVVGIGLEPARIERGCLVGSIDVVLDAPGASRFLLAGVGQDRVERWFVVPADAVLVEPTAGLDLTRRTGAVRVDAEVADLVDVPDLDGDLLRRTLVTFAAAEAAGVARWCLEAAVEHARVREQFGRPIGSFQAVKHHLADALLRLEFARPAVYRAAHSLATADDQAERSRDVSMAKAFASDAALLAARVGLQVHGAIGYTWEHDLHLWMKPAWQLASMYGDAAWHRARVARALGVTKGD
jgi:hypothetical protein